MITTAPLGPCVFPTASSAMATPPGLGDEEEEAAMGGSAEGEAEGGGERTVFDSCLSPGMPHVPPGFFVDLDEADAMRMLS